MNRLTKELNIEDMIYEIRGVQVITDRDLAKLYKVSTKSLNQTVKRNIKRFPESYMFQLNYDEFLIWRSRFVTSKNDKQGLRRPPYVFTEHGVSMLAGLLKSDVAIQTSLKIINSFVRMRKYFSTTMIEQKHINNLVLEDHSKREIVKKTLLDTIKTNQES